MTRNERLNNLIQWVEGLELKSYHGLYDRVYKKARQDYPLFSPQTHRSYAESVTLYFTVLRE